MFELHIQPAGIPPQAIADADPSPARLQLRRSSIARQMIEIEGECPTGITRRLYFREHRLSVEIESRYPRSCSWKQEIDAMLRERVEIPVGWLPVFDRLTKQRGIHVAVDDWAQIALPLPDLRSGFDDRDFIRFIAKNPRGLIRIIPETIQVDKLLRQLLAAWPRHNFLAIVRTVEQAKSLYQQLKVDVKSVDLVRNRLPKPQKRMLIGVASGIGRWEARLPETDIVVVADAGLLVGGTHYEQLRDNTRGRIYGLVPIGRQLVPYAEDRVTSLLGFEELTLWRHGQVSQPVFVRTIKNPNARRLNTSKPSHVLRRGIWENERRNWLVADESRRQLARVRQLRHESGTTDKFPWIVGVIAANACHAMRLAAHLRDWPVEQEDLTGWVTDLITSRSRPAVAGVICTLDTPGFEWLTTIIRADAGPGCGIDPQDVNVYRPLPLVVVDIVDRHHPLLKEWRNERLQAYRKAGFVVNCQSPADCAVERFLLQHPLLPSTQ